MMTNDDMQRRDEVRTGATGPTRDKVARRACAALVATAVFAGWLVAGFGPAVVARADEASPTTASAAFDATTRRAVTRPVRRAATTAAVDEEPEIPIEQLRAMYSVPPGEWPAADWDENVPVELRRELGRVPKVEFPEDNPYTREKAQLGWRLFFDPRLSGSGHVACVSCHHPDTGWADGRVNSMGHGLTTGKRNAPTLMGTAYEQRLMWDGRAESLEMQVMMPLHDQGEMHAEFDQIEANLRAVPAYNEEFKQVFGSDSKPTVGKAAKAIATFVRTIVPGRSRFDRYLATGRVNLLRDSELRGLHLFRTKARCINCHGGPLMSDGQFHNVGLTYYARKFEDLGRYEITRDPADVGKFKTPTLRNLARTAPYMHNGLFELPGLLNLYNVGMPTERRTKGPNDPLKPVKSPILKPLNLTPEEKLDLADFLNDALLEPRLRVRAPVIPGLYGADPTTVPALPGPAASTRLSRGPSTAATVEEAVQENEPD